jgi:GxxExxY protein
MSSKSTNESRVSLINDGSVGSNMQKIIQQKDKILQQKDKKILGLETKIEKLQSRLKKKEEKKTAGALKKKEKAESKKQELSNWNNEINATAILIAQLSRQVYTKFPYGGKEHHYQALLEVELQRKGFVVQSEVAVLYKVTSTSGEVLQLPHDIRGREDLLLPQEKMILELKQTKGLGDGEQQQLLRYMYQRQTFSEWGDETKGMLINFGDEDLEIWLVQFNDRGDTDHVRLMKLPRIVNKSWEDNAFKMTT